jgi:pimeloyl-ACP methyl ester carboxylesterase
MLIIILILIALSILLLLELDRRKKMSLKRKYEGKECREGKLENINGINTYYIEMGEGEPILLIHGFMASSIEFIDIIEILSRKYKVIAIDLIGFGRSDKSLNLDYSKKNMGDIVASLLISKGYNNVNVIAHSMGGEVGLNLAYHHKSLVKTLILVDSVGCKVIKWPIVPIFFLRYIFKLYYLQNLFYKLCLHNSNFYDVNKFDRVFYLNCSISPETLHAFECGNDKFHIEKVISEIFCTTLIIWGRYDRIIPLKRAYRFNKLINGSKLLIFENSGHLPYVEEKQKFIEVVEEFINKAINN